MENQEFVLKKFGKLGIFFEKVRKIMDFVWKNQEKVWKNQEKVWKILGLARQCVGLGRCLVWSSTGDLRVLIMVTRTFLWKNKGWYSSRMVTTTFSIFFLIFEKFRGKIMIFFENLEKVWKNREKS